MPVHFNAPPRHNPASSASLTSSQTAPTNSGTAAPIATPDEPTAGPPTEHSAALKLQHMFRRTVAASAYHHMFSKGSVFEASSLPYAAQAQRLHPESLAHLDKVSKQSLKNIKSTVGTLSPEEKNLLIQVNRSPWFFRHQTDAGIETSDNDTSSKSDKLVIKSNLSLTRDATTSKTHTLNVDLKFLSNNDFVFFATEMTDAPKKQGKLLSTTHNGHDFGAFAYLIPETDPRVKHGYLTVADHMFSFMTPAGSRPEGAKWRKTNPEAKNQFSRNTFQDKALGMTPMFRAQDMKQGVGLYLIHNLRKTSDEDFRQKVFNARANDPVLHDAIQLIMQPEFHIPRIVATRDYLKITHREPDIGDMLAAGNLTAADKIPLKKEEGIALLETAIHDLNKKSIEYLTHRFEFSAADMNQITDAHYFLSRIGSTPSIVQPFLEKGLIDVNKPFEVHNCDDVMLHNCIKYNNQPLAALLIEYGANPALLSPEHQISLHNVLNS